MTEAIRVFVAASASEWLAMRVLEFSIRESASLPVEFSALYTFNRPIPVPQAKKNWPRTPFSFQRFLIPELCEYQGKAIYLDADMLVFRDMAELWNQPLDFCDLQTVYEARKGLPSQFSVMLLDCSRLSWSIDTIISALDSGELEYSSLMHNMCVVKNIGWDIPPEWNSLEHYESEVTALLHYTNMHTQPWVSLANPLGSIWVEYLRRALEAECISKKELEREVAVGHVRPSLTLEVERVGKSMVDSVETLKQVDRGFVPPYKGLSLDQSGAFSSIRRFGGRVYHKICRSIMRTMIFVLI